MCNDTQIDSRVLVLGVVEAETDAVSHMLERCGIEARRCSSLSEMCTGIVDGAAAFIVAESLINTPAAAQLVTAIEQQPPWSDIPMVVLVGTSDGMRPDCEGSDSPLDRLSCNGCAYFVDRPIRERVLRRTIRCALAARQRQYKLRDLLVHHEQTEQALRQSAARFRTMFDSAHNGIVLVNESSIITAANPAAAAVLGYSQEQLVGRSTRDLLAPEYESQREDIRDQLAESGMWQGELPVLRADGKLIYLSCNAIAHFEPGIYMGILTEITDRKLAEEALRVSHERYQLAGRATNDAVWDLDVRSGELIWNESLTQLFGYPLDAVGSTIDWWLKNVHPDDRERVNQDLAETLNSRDEQWSAEYRFRRVNGQYAVVYDRGFIERDRRGVAVRMVGAMLDLTERKRVQILLERALEEANTHRARAEQRGEVLDAIMEYLPEGLAIAEGPDASIRMMSRLGRELIGEDTTGMTPEQTLRTITVLHGDGVTPARVEDLPLVRAATEGELINNEEWMVQRTDGRRFSILCNAGPIRDTQGRITGALLCWRDITSRRMTEVALRESEERLSMALNAGLMGAWEWHIPSGRVIWSPTLEAIHGREPGTFDGTFQSFQSDIHPDDYDVVIAAIDRAMHDHEEYHVEYRIIRPDQRITWVEARGRLLLNADGEPERMTGVCADVTDRKLVEEELARHRDHLAELVNERTKALEESHQRLRHSERMAAMGTLAAGLGHDMGNLVFPLRIRLDLMKSKSMPKRLRDDLEAIDKAVDYLQRLANGLRHMAMDPSEIGVGMETTELCEWWADVEPVLSNALPRGIALEHRFERNLPGIAVAPHGLTQVVFNLVQNSSEAMRDRESGVISVVAERGEDSTLRIMVRDDGPGMSPDVRRRCLEPFFTTKVRGISTGLGLALVHGVVSRAGGTIELESEVGAGTTWRLTFPVTPDHQAAAANSRTNRLARVTIADARMCAFVTAMLNSLGYEVTTQHSNNGDLRLWIAEVLSPEIEAAAMDFLNDDDTRRVVLLGEGEMAGDDDGDDVLPGRLVRLDRNPTSEAIRRSLRQVLRDRPIKAAKGTQHERTGQGALRR